MKNYYPIVFRSGESAIQSLSVDLLNFYSWLCEKWLGEKFKLVEGANAQSTPLSNTEMLNHPHRIYPIISDITDAWKDKVNIFILDLRGSFRGQIIIHLGSAVKNFFANKGSSYTETRFLILLNEMPPDGDAFLAEILDRIKDNSVTIFDTKGNCTNRQHLKVKIHDEDYRLKLIKAEDKPSDLLSIKMIRRLGHFRHEVDGKHESCRRYFYDGSKCTREIAEIIKAEIQKNIQNGKRLLVLYYSPISEWLVDALFSVHMDLQMGIEEIDNAVKNRLIMPNDIVIFIEVMLHTGRSFKHYYSLIKKECAEAKIVPYAILATGIRSDNSVRKVNVEGVDIDVSCLVKIHQKEYQIGECDMCELNLPWSNRKDEDFDMLTSFDFWDLCKEAGFIPEKNIPGNREPLKIVPDFTSVIKNHGSWLVYKIEKLLQSNGISSDDLVIICPEEDFPLIYDNYIKLILNVTVIQIPRSVLDNIRSKDGDISELLEMYGNERPLWFQQLESLRTDEVIILDEFTKSGGTFSALHTLVKHKPFSKHVQKYLPLVDFNPSSERSESTISLYEFET